MKKHMMLAIVAIAMLLPLSTAFAADVFLTKTELIQWDPDKSFYGYNLFVNGGTNWLIDMEGRVVNSWDPVAPSDATFGMYSFLMENGNLRAHLTPSVVPAGAVAGQGGAQGRIAEYTWDGERVWYVDVFDFYDLNNDGEITEDDQIETTSFFGTRRSYTGTYRFHHDAQRMYNSKINKWTYMVLIWIGMDEDDADQMGVADDQKYRSRDTDGNGVATWSPCALIEILPDYAAGVGGDIIWYWTFNDHMVTTNPAGDPILDRDTETFMNWGGRLSRPPLVVSNLYDTGDGDSIEGHPELLDVNGMHYFEPGGPNIDYQHCNSFDYDEELGYVAINAKACNEFFVIDHDGTFDTDATWNDWDSVGGLARGDGGNFLYRYGNPENYKSGRPGGFYDQGDMEMYGTHDIQWIMNYHWRPPMNLATDNWEDPADFGDEYALPGGGLDDAGAGYGNFLMFDNGCYSPMTSGSKILEVNPYLQGDGTEASDYIWMAASVEIPTGIDSDTLQVTTTDRDSINNPTGLKRRDQVTWTFPRDTGMAIMGSGGGGDVNNFYSSYISGQTRMPNGNTVICAGSHSHFFEVTDTNQVVWEYVMPPASQGVFQTTKNSANMCFRMHRYAANHPALKGRDLTPGSTLTGKLPVGLDYALEEGATSPVVVTPPAPTGWGTSGLSVGEGGGGSAGGSSGGGTGGGY